VLVESTDIKTKAFAELFKSEGKAVVKKIVNYHLMNEGVSRYESLDIFLKIYYGASFRMIRTLHCAIPFLTA